MGCWGKKCFGHFSRRWLSPDFDWCCWIECYQQMGFSEAVAWAKCFQKLHLLSELLNFDPDELRVVEASRRFGVFWGVECRYQCFVSDGRQKENTLEVFWWQSSDIIWKFSLLSWKQILKLLVNSRNSFSSFYFFYFSFQQMRMILNESGLASLPDMNNMLQRIFPKSLQYFQKYIYSPAGSASVGVRFVLCFGRKR